MLKVKEKLESLKSADLELSNYRPNNQPPFRQKTALRCYIKPLGAVFAGCV